MATSMLRVRRSITELQAEHDGGNTKPLDDLMRAWKTIKELPPDDPRSFFTLGGYHGEPFRGAGWGDSAYWGGYCNHGNVLFPTWHRVYMVKLEEALRSVDGCDNVTLPYWNETSTDSRTNGIPWALTNEKYVLDGVEIDNPLRSFVFTKNIKDHINNDSPDYSKPKGYETVRYPLSGLVGTEKDRVATKAHNEHYADFQQNVDLLNANIRNWLSSTVVIDGKPISAGKIVDKYAACLDAPNYTVFSNTTSAAEWNDEHAGNGEAIVVPLESPHNSIHLAVGGFDVPGADFSPIHGANGDMGENDTAGLDPIFFFHHCFVDRVFWEWQKRHGATDDLEIIPGYPGTNSVDSQGPTPGTVPNTWLTLDSPLDPFTLVDNGRERPFTSRDCLNIESQLGFTYADDPAEDTSSTPISDVAGEASSGGSKVAVVSGINRAPLRGSFVVSVFGDIDGERVLLGAEAVLNRWSVKYCANCQTHLEVRSFVGLDAVPDAQFDEGAITWELHTRDGVHTPAGPPAASPASAMADHAVAVSAPAGLIPTADPPGQVAQSVRLEIR